MKRLVLILFIALLPALLPAQDELRIQLLPGHNLISCNLRMPREFFREGENRGPNVPLMMAQLGNNIRFLGIMEDERGRFYAPRLNFCNIPYWDVTDGYLLVMNQATEIVWEGERLPADMNIPMNVGWNIISYLPEYRLNHCCPK
ncbi:MAG: hypothetical protein FJY65_12745 [Calditrichaeota bacterium]|nr:hypothetical protein [Calditrichota bacterium]